MNYAEKRKHIRFDAVNPSEVNIYSDNVLVKEGQGKTLNISKGGALLETTFPIEEGEKLALIISIDTDFVYISGQVAHTQCTNGQTHQTGVEFFAIDETGQQILEKYIALFSRNQSAESS